MSNISLKVEFMAGTTIEEAVKEAKEKAIEFNVAFIKFSFNGVKLSISQKCSVESAVMEYRLQLKEVHYPSVIQ